MTDFKPGDTVRRVRNSTGEPDSFLAIKPGEFLTVREVITGFNGLIKLVSTKGEYARAADCELVEEDDVCRCCGQALPKPKTLTVPSHTIPWHLTEQPEEGAKVWSIEPGIGADRIHYSHIHHEDEFLDGLLYATEAEAQARYESWVAPTRRGEDV